MRTLLERIDTRVSASCRAKTCRKEGCRLKLDGLPRRRRLIDMDHAAAPGPAHEVRCDYLYFDDGGDAPGRVVSLELKSGSPRAGEIAAQLQAGANVAEHLVGDDIAVGFTPVAAHGGRMHRHRVNSFARRENQVTFRQTAYRVELLKCGVSLIDALRRRGSS